MQDQNHDHSGCGFQYFIIQRGKKDQGENAVRVDESINLNMEGVLMLQFELSAGWNLMDRISYFLLYGGLAFQAIVKSAKKMGVTYHDYITHK